MIPSFGYAASAAGAQLAPFHFERRDPGPNDLGIEILYCGICHTDMHMVNNDWKLSLYPVVPGHEIIGRVTTVGKSVAKFKPGDIAGIGCLVDSCRTCAPCACGDEHFCEQGVTQTYGGYERGTQRLNYGGYSNNYVVDERFALRIPAKLDPAAAAPLLCAGITTYSPLRHWQMGPGKRVGIVGLGGLGHMAVKLACAFGAQVFLFTTSPDKAVDARRLGAHEVVLSTDEQQMKAQRGSLDFILDTVSAPHDLHTYLRLLKRNATMCLVGMPAESSTLRASQLALGRKSLAGSIIGGLRETQEMLDFCGEHGIVAEIERIRIAEVNQAYARMLRNDVKYRFVIDMRTLSEQLTPRSSATRPWTVEDQR